MCLYILNLDAAIFPSCPITSNPIVVGTYSCKVLNKAFGDARVQCVITTTVRHPRVCGDPEIKSVSSFNKNNLMAKCIIFTVQKDYMFSISDSFLKHFENLVRTLLNLSCINQEYHIQLAINQVKCYT